MKTVCEIDKCVGCMACIDICTKNAIQIVDSLKSYNAVIGDQCVNCGACHKICQKNNPTATIKPQYWYQGWAYDMDVRAEGSSGGFAMAIASAFINAGGVVCSCMFNNGEFGFYLENTVEDLHQFAGSKYVKSNPKGIYKTIRSKLKEGEKVLFIALPCQVAALKNYMRNNLENNLYTIDLICHGTPSPKILEIFLKQYGVKLEDLKAVQFRNKSIFQVAGDSKGIVAEGIIDRYMISFLSALTYTDNCFECDYARKERVADLTLGDSWGSVLSSEEWKKGISLVLCQTERGKRLLEQSNLSLNPIDLDLAIAHNHQLEHPSIKPQGRDEFFDDLSRNKKFNSLVMKALPKKCWKQNIKLILVKTKSLVGGKPIA